MIEGCGFSQAVTQNGLCSKSGIHVFGFKREVRRATPMSGTGLTIPYTLGCSLSFIVTWTDSAGDPIDLTGWTATIFGATQEFSGGRVTATITDAAAGELTVSIDAIDSLPLRRTDIGFRFKIHPSGSPEDGKSLGFVSVYAT